MVASVYATTGALHYDIKLVALVLIKQELDFSILFTD